MNNNLKEGLDQIANTIARHVPHAKLEGFNESIVLSIPGTDRGVDISRSPHEFGKINHWKVYMADENDVYVDTTPYPGDAAAKAINFLVHGHTPATATA